MGMSTYCSLNALPPSPPHDPGSSPPKTTLMLRSTRRKNKSVMASIAITIVIGLEVGDLINTNMNGEFNSMASEMAIIETKLNNNNNNKRRIARWSEKRICPPWHINSLETIVPENLPRRSFARSKWEGASYSILKSAPSTQFSPTTKISCFTM
ncbi:protein CHLOROPLAST VESICULATION isoform X2 [Silene latifolia]|uniref:protein CHLOROPLAST VESICULATION isoform X2 n=1 Tax=Silene latifolia TaxID=37657 RepID=UPI003D76CD65